jgi:hypothetical protein
MLVGDPIAFIPRCPYRHRTGDWNTNKGVDLFREKFSFYQTIKGF